MLQLFLVVSTTGNFVLPHNYLFSYKSVQSTEYTGIKSIVPSDPDLDKVVGVVVHGVVVVVVHGRALDGRLEDLVVGGGVPGHHVDVPVDDVLEVLDGVAARARRHFFGSGRGEGKVDISMSH